MVFGQRSDYPKNFPRRLKLIENLFLELAVEDGL